MKYIRRFFVNIIFPIFFAFVIGIFLRDYVINISLVSQTSMLPTLKDGDVLVSEKISGYLDKYDRGDIIIFNRKEDGINYVKRIIAKPYDKIEIVDGSVYLNGNLYEEDYLQEKILDRGELVDASYTYADDKIWLLGEDEYFVMGDNRSRYGSMDSREFGPVRKDEIVGEVKFRIYPEFSLDI